PQSFSVVCGNSTHTYLPLNSALRESILEHVNYVRSFVASGLFNWTTAARMPTMMWDRKLAFAAKTLLHICDTESICMNSKKFKYVATVEISGIVPHLEDVPGELLQLLVKSWMNDIHGCRVTNTRAVSTEPGSCIGHYIPLIQDHGNRMGCAMRYDSVSSKLDFGEDGDGDGDDDDDDDSQNRLVLICNLSRAHVNNMPHYAVGQEPGEACKVGIHPFYTVLCDANEPVDNN
ncbi:hypothetical protein KR093_001312, partial [Drosophila rubida]